MKRREQLILLLGSLFLVALGVVCEGHGKGNHIRSLPYTVNPEVKVDQNLVYNQFLLVEQWAGTLCRYTSKSCSQGSSVFTIHGLWPQNTAAWPKDNCCAQPLPKPEKCYYNSSTISADLRGNLNRSWPDLSRTYNDEFWGYEWGKHGACSVDELPQSQYFQNANTLYNNPNFNILNILNRAGIRANGSTYTRLSISNALRNGTGFNVNLQCVVNGSNTYLQEVKLCVNPSATAFQNCSSPKYGRCGDKNVTFPLPYEIKIPVYNQFLLVEQWAGTLCRYTRSRCSQRSSVFTIHGLWPQNTTAWRPGSCCAIPKPRPIPAKCNYSRSAISGNLRGKLNSSWPNLLGDNDVFWGHEWEKHGACSVDELPQPQYFQNANTLYNNSNYDILNILIRAGIRPNGTAYPRRLISNAFTTLKVSLQCYVNGSNTYLQEVKLCVNSRATAFQNCTPTYGRCGDKNVIFPTPYA